MTRPVFLLTLVALLGCVQADDAPRWTVFHAPALKDALAPLADHRRSQGYEVEWVEVRADKPEAFLAKLETIKAAPPHPGDVVVLAGAMAGGEVRHDCVLPGGKGTRGRMKDRASDGVLATGGPGGTARLTLGRLPAETPEDMTAMVAKILRYENYGAAAKGQLRCVVGNPMGLAREWAPDLFLAVNTRLMLAKVESGWRVDGAADLLISPFGGRTADFGMEMDRVASGPWEVLSYFGHSGPEGIYSLGKTFRLSDAWFVSAGPPRGIFFTCGCHAMDSQDAYAVRAMRTPSGPAAVIGSAGVSYSTIGYLAGKGLTACTAEKDGPGTAGEWWGNILGAIEEAPMSKLSFTIFDRIDGSGGKVSLQEQRLEHLEMWSLLGDPAMRMPSAEKKDSQVAW
jgi:hypothetical protein